MPAVLLNILSYDGSVLDCALNYVALIVTSVALTFAFISTSWHDERLQRLPFLMIPIEIFLFIFQIVLCVIESCVGISVVWSGLCGINMLWMYWFCNSPNSLNNCKMNDVSATFFILSLLFCVAIWIYYAIVDNLLTSIAHFCAILLGFALGFICKFFATRLLTQGTTIAVNQSSSSNSRLEH
eukprot:gene8644-11684_t